MYGRICSKQSIRDVFSILLTPKQQRQSGLHKLTPAERNNLSNSIMEFFRTIMKSKEIGDSAVEFLKNDGWEEVKVVGTRRLKLDQWSDPEEYLIVEESVWTYTLESRTYFFKLNPGKYLGKMGLSTSEIIDSDGDVIRFWTKDKE